MGSTPGTAIRTESKSQQSRLPVLKNSPSSPPRARRTSRLSEGTLPPPPPPPFFLARPKASTVVTDPPRINRPCCPTPGANRRISAAETSPGKVRLRRMTYQPPECHIMAPCSTKSLTHRLSCAHLVATAKPTDMCAGNCAGASGSGSMFSLRSIPRNPRDLDMTIVCPMCAPSDSKVQAAKKRKGYRLSQLIGESVRPSIGSKARDSVASFKSDSSSENPLGLHFKGCAPVKRIDSVFSGAGDETVAKRERPKICVAEQKTLKVLLLDQDAGR